MRNFLIKSGTTLSIHDIDFIKASCGLGDYLLLRSPLPSEQLEGFAFQDLAQRLCSRRLGVGADGLIAFTRRSGVSPSIHTASTRFTPDVVPVDALFCAARFLFDSGEYGVKPFTLQSKGRIFTVESVDSQNFRLEVPSPTNSGQLPDWHTPLQREQYLEQVVVPWETPQALWTQFKPSPDAQSLRRSARLSAVNHPARPIVLFSVAQKDLISAWVRLSSWVDHSSAASAVALSAHLDGLSSDEVLVSLNDQPFFVQISFPGPRIWVTAPVRYLFQGLYAPDTSFFT